MPRGASANSAPDQVMAFLKSMDRAVAEAVVRQGNDSGKTSLHMACQYNPLLVETLMDFGAEASVSIRRGHTPLIFAAGRGHDEMLLDLLQRGANPRVITVTGQSAASMGRGHLQPETQAALEAAELSDSRPWQDFRTDAVALAAQAEYAEKRDAYYQGRQEKEQALAEAERLLNVEWTARATLVVDALRQGTEPGRAAVVTALERASPKKGDKGCPKLASGGVKEVFKMAFKRIFASGDGELLLRVLEVCREDEIGPALADKGVRDRRPIRIMIRALFLELEEGAQHIVGQVKAADITASTTLNLAMEVVRLMGAFLTTGDREAVESMWQETCSTAAAPAVVAGDWAYTANAEDYSMEILFVVGPRLSKQNGGSPVAEWVRLLRWASSVQHVTPLWLEMCEQILLQARMARLTDKLLEAVSGLDDLPSNVKDIVRAAVPFRQSFECNTPGPAPFARVDGEFALKDVLGFDQVSRADLPQYALSLDIGLLSSDEDVSNVLIALQQMVEELKDEEWLLVGVDTEWGESEDNRSPPSVVQLAALDRVWVLDTALPRPSISSLIRWVFGCKRLKLLGFAFSHDIQRLASLAEDGDSAAGQLSAQEVVETEVVDLQLIAQRQTAKGCTPGLKVVSEMWLGKTLDKTEQCSDWDRRPLSDSQLRYAAADAAVLLDIAHAMGLA
ncbi:unnamed protein product [Polarella glacialis]|uniref:3'-5' exonuclease domain-containing protein n=1 Tax=Polarella glacialis TaxID=89957 RepID=A0A813F6Q2_POLGL|nr:unnamed protein product [Polarella glacialis]